MTYEKRMILIGIAMLSFLFLISESSAVGLIGNDLDVLVDFEPGLQRDFIYGVAVTNPEITDYEAFSVEELAKYVTVEPRYLKFEKSLGGTPTFKATLKLPMNEKEVGAGRHCTGIGVVENVPAETSGEKGIKMISRTSAKARVCVRVLYDGKHVEARLSVPNTNEGGLLRPEVEISNWGKENITSAYAEVSIYDANGSEIRRVKTNTAPVPSKESIKVFNIMGTAGMNPGDYRADAVVYYDGAEKEVSETFFKIGTLYVRIIDYTKEITSGEISKFYVRAESRWNSRIKEIYARVLIGDQEMRTPPISLEPWTEGTMEGYVDAGGFAVGEIPARVIVYYEGETTVSDGIISVIKPPRAKFEWFKDLNFTLVLIILLVIVVELIWIIGKRIEKKKSWQEKMEWFRELRKRDINLFRKNTDYRKDK